MYPKAESPGVNPGKRLPGKGNLRDRVPLPGQSLVTESAATQEHCNCTPNAAVAQDYVNKVPSL